MTFKKWVKTPKGYVAAAMACYLILASIGYKDMAGFKNAIIAIIAGVVVDTAINIIKGRKWTVPDGAVITGLIIALVSSTAASMWVVTSTAVLAILSKHFIVYKNKPIFNPAALGLLLSYLLFRTGQSWWGAFGDLTPWAIPLLLIGGYVVVNRVHKFPQVFAFSGTSFLILAIMGFFHSTLAADAFRPPFINATLFFAFFMLTDLPTSPAKDKDQVVYGFLTGASGSLIYALSGGLLYLFIGLCLGNLFTYYKKRSASKTKMSKPVSMRRSS
ncbi:RnfABCDGE type electron transport complex subunit D [Falsibacillus pallidus]|uniref:Na+-translocating ferredoxin:NAD+ oxidoreductase RnfD subunit n=1 Tax=Falsibacillus pallidus TaxID=493781 RepID=A0A370GP32_9BACI|nr:RnfABCDGE type electron transport complex subunit D [Falsibacillus pallidus]RDI45495.1 Na+-translocating ferredoxin:NAD+ oxidoreductase RnfD subunit [Falsibacillus pallidus]